MKLNSILTKLDWEIRTIPPNSTITFINPYSYLLTRNVAKLDNIDFIGIDGGLLKSTFNLFLSLKTKRVSFDNSSLAPKLFDYCIDENKSIYFIGATNSNIESFISVLKREKFKLGIIGYRNGYFENNVERDAVLKKICNLNPDFVIVGMGSPFQENFILDLKKIGYKGISFTCGGYFHQTGKAFTYYPYLFNKLNLRWLYRIIDEPKLFKRYFLYYPKSMFFVFLDLFKYKFF